MMALAATVDNTLAEQRHAAEADIVIHGAGTTEANGLYKRVDKEKNFMTDGGIAMYKKEGPVEKGHELDWKWWWIVSYYPEANPYGPAWYIQQGEESAYVSKVKKNPDHFPDMSSIQVPFAGWNVYTDLKGLPAWGLKGAKKPVPLLENTRDLNAAIVLLQHLAEGKDVTSMSRDAPLQIAPLAYEARKMKIPGAIVSDRLWKGAKSCKPYDEMRGERGKIRPAYTQVVKILQTVMEEDAKKKKSDPTRNRIDDFPTSSNKDFKGDNRLYHIPRMLTQAETDLLIKGIGQRARALRQFVLDMTRSRGVEKMACVRAGALPECVYRRIAARAAHKPTLDLIDKAEVNKFYWSVWYGPDIIRGPDGNGGTKFYVVEDNFGYVGGFGDIIESRKVLLKTFPELEPTFAPDQTAHFYDEMAKHYLAMVAPGEKVVVLYYQRHGGADATECTDNEDRRMAMVFKKRNIEPVALPGDDGPTPGQPYLQVRNKKVYLVSPKKSRQTTLPRGSPTRGEVVEEPPKKRLRSDGMWEEPVGMVILLSEPIDVEPGHESTRLRASIENAKSAIEEHEDEVKEAKLKAKGAEKTVMQVNNKVEVTDKEGLKNILQMNGNKLTWILHNKSGVETERVKGVLAWNALRSTLSDGIYGQNERKFDEDNTKALEKAWVLEELPLEAAKAKAWAQDLRTAVENVGQLVGGRANDQAPAELFRLLRLHDKEGWNKLMKGKRGCPGLMEAYFSGGVKLANGPGFVILDDKELCAHTDKLVTYYLNEEPILNTIPTRSFAMEPDLLATVFDDPVTQENVVVKRVDGRGGDAVWVGAKLSRTDFLACRGPCEAEPDAFLVQRYTALSQVDNHLVDIRGPAFITSNKDLMSGGEGVSVSPVLWGRGVPEKGGNGKVNISDAGFQLTIVTSADA